MVRRSSVGLGCSFSAALPAAARAFELDFLRLCDSRRTVSARRASSTDSKSSSEGARGFTLPSPLRSSLQSSTVAFTPARTDEPPGEPCGEVFPFACIEADQHALDFRQVLAVFRRLSLEPLAFRLAQRHAGQRPAQQRRHAERGDHGHEHDDGGRSAG